LSLILSPAWIGINKAPKSPSEHQKERFKCGMLLKAVEWTNTAVTLHVSAPLPGAMES
jgi:hypothetical protein